MGVSIKEIYSPILGYGWENPPSDYIKREYLPVEDGIVTTPSGTKLGTAFLANGDYNNSSEATVLLMGLSKGVHHVEG